MEMAAAAAAASATGSSGGDGGGGSTPLFDANSIGSGALMLVLISTMTAYIYRVWDFVQSWIYQKFLITITVSKTDPAYGLLLLWMAENRDKMTSASNLTMTSSGRRSTAFGPLGATNVASDDEDGRYGDDDDGSDVDASTKELLNGKALEKIRAKELRKAKNDLKFAPGSGSHVLTFRNKWIWIDRYVAEPKPGGGWQSKPFVHETLTLSMWGTKPDVLEQLFLEAWKSSKTGTERRTSVYALDEDAWSWRLSTQAKPRPLSSVVLDGDGSARLLKDMSRFLKSRKWYERNGVPYRRGYLLYGPPGCGKTSTVSALACTLQLNICVVSLSSRSLTDENLAARIRDVPRGSIVLLEDVDAVFLGRSATAEARDQARVTFSGLLNALDGVAAQEGRILFMTTNHIERLDAALIRPGRCDVHVAFQLASRDQLYRLFLRFCPGEKDLAREFSEALPANALSPAALQGHFLKYRDDPLMALKKAGELLKDKSHGSKHNAHMPLGVWLRRLALPQRYAQTLVDMNLAFVSDLASMEDSDVVELMNVKNVVHKVRIEGYLQGKSSVHRMFAFQQSGALYSAFEKYMKAFQQQPRDQDDASAVKTAERGAWDDLADEFVERVGPNRVTMYQLEEFLSNYVGDPLSCLNHLDSFLAKVDHWIQPDGSATSSTNDRHQLLASRDMLKETERHALGVETVKEWLEEIGHSDKLPKFEEQHISDMRQVVEFGESDLEEFGFDKRGDRWTVAKDLERRKALVELST